MINLSKLKTIPCYENYMACEDGFIYSKNYNRTGRMKKLKSSPIGSGYLAVNLSKNNKKKTITIHSLVMIVFKGKKKGGYEVNHKNGIKTDNRLFNLEYCTRSENIKHAYDTGLSKRGEKHYRSNLTKNKVIEIKIFIKNTPKFYGMYKILSEKYNINYSTIINIIHGVTWKHIKI